VARKPPANLHLIKAPPEPDYPAPPRPLGEHGASLWRDIVTSYEFSDRASYETLAQACAALDRAERCRELIDEQGEMIPSRTGMRSHPLLRDELANRAFVTRALAKLGLDLEPLRSGPGRPGGGVGMSWKDLPRAD
jgi:hypothetical protein